MTPQAFLKDFGAVANAPGGVQRLREMILQLAVSGKLVQQKYDEEPAVDLLKKIEDKKQELIKSKTIKSKKIPALKSNDYYLNIPASWKWARLEALGNIFNGNSVNAKVKNEKYAGLKHGIPFIATKDVEYGFATLNYDNGVRVPIEEPKFKVAHKGAVLICSEGGSAGKKCGITTKDICFGNKLFAFESYANIESRYILSLYLSPGFYKQFQERMTGIIGGISRANFSSIPIPLPPFEEQKRIVAKVDQLMALCDKLEKQQQKRSILIRNTRISALDALANAQERSELKEAWRRIQDNLPMLFEGPKDVEDLKKCILQNAVMGKLVSQNPNDEPASELLKKIAKEKEKLILLKEIKKQKPLPEIHEDEKPFDIPNGWEWCRLPEIGELARGKSKHRPRNDIQLYQNGTIPLVQTGDVARSNGLIKTHTALYNDVGLKQSRLWAKGTLCITIAANIADTGILTFNACFPDSVVGFVPIEQKLDISYFDYYIRTAKEHLEKFAPSTAQKNINLEILSQLLVPLPPMNELNSIVNSVKNLFSFCEKLQKQLSSSHRIAGQLAQAVVESISGISTEKKKKMKAPKTELITKLKLVKKPSIKKHAPLSAILVSNNDELSAKSLWNHSGMAIDEFYRQLKIEMVNGWIEEPQKAEVHIIEE